MEPNPFSPSFTIMPRSFYGRTSYIDAYSEALVTPGSAQQCIFLTGTRGSGKTSLLYQFERVAKGLRWDVLRVTNIDALDRLMRYAGMGTTTTKSRTVNPSLSVPGVLDLSVGSVGSTVQDQQPATMLSARLVERVGRLKTKAGLAVIVDEAQKLGQEDAVLILNAVQDVKSQGLPVSLVLCGLPNTYNRIRSLSDVTFVRRMRRVKLWTMTKTETLDFLRGAFRSVPELLLSDDQVFRMGSFSGGHPYLMQLVGDNVYRLARKEFDPMLGQRVKVPDALIGRAENLALAEYRENVLSDVMRGAHPKTREYLEAAFLLRDDTGRVRVADINRHFSMGPQEMSTRRASALNTQILRDDGYGVLRFALPHYRYIFEEFEYNESETSDDEWEL